MLQNKRQVRPAEHTRRQFARQMVFAGASLALTGRPGAVVGDGATVALVKGTERKAAISTVIESLGELDCQGKDVYLKGNFNSADPYPASTHPDALARVVQILREKDCGRITLIERSGMGQTHEIWQKLGISDLARRIDLTVLALEDLPAAEWCREELPGSHWKRGVEVPRFLTKAVFLVQICNLKTHRFGGQFSASLKNSIGLLAKHARIDGPYNYMAELHNSPDQRLMIAEVNQIYQPSLVVMDADQVFVSGGPESGDMVSAGVIAASHDRVALDASGLALLRHQGAGQPLNRMPVFEQEQIKRAAALRLGVSSGEEIHFLTHDQASRVLASQLSAILSQKPEEEKNSQDV